MKTTYLKINAADNVAVAIEPLKSGEQITIAGDTITVNEDIPAGHKIALKDFAEGENIIKYGYPIGHAIKAVKQGDWINENHVKTNLAGNCSYLSSISNKSFKFSSDDTAVLPLLPRYTPFVPTSRTVSPRKYDV